MGELDPSVQDWRNHLLNSLKGTGKLDTLKSQLRARLVDQLRDQDGTLLEFKGNRKPSLTDRILTSLFLDYLRAYGFSFTQSVFLPESQAGSWPAFTFEEISQLLHLNPTTPCNRYLKIGPREKGCFALQLIMALQQMPFRTGTQDSSTQTNREDQQDLDGCLREIDDICFQNKVSESRITFRSLEERLNTFRQEFETRVNAEVALRVSRNREYETNAVRIEEEGRYRRQLARERDELEQIHKTRLERIREREESLMEQLAVKEKAIETSAYEQRQKLLASITDLRDREDRVKDTEELQKRRDDALEEKDTTLRMKEADISQREAIIYAQAGSDAQMKMKDLEEMNRSCQEQLQSERNLLEAERIAYREEKTRLGNELAAMKSDRDLVHSLNGRLTSDEKRRMELVNSLLERLTSEEEQRSLSIETTDDFHFRTTLDGGSPAKPILLDTRSESKNGLSDESNLGCKNCQQQHRRWARDQTKAEATIKQLEKAVQEAEDGKNRAQQARRAIQLQLKSSDSELLETVSLMKKTQHALELERLHHYALRSQIASVFTLPSHDKFGHQGAGLTSLDSGYILNNEPRFKASRESVPELKDLGSGKYIEADQREYLYHNQVISGQLPSNNAMPCIYQTKCKYRDLSSMDGPSSTRVNQVGAALTCHREGNISSDNNSETPSTCTQKHREMIYSDETNLPCQLAVVDGLGKECLPSHRGRTEVEYGSESSGYISGIDRKQMSAKQIGKKTARSHQDEPTHSSCYPKSPGSDNLASNEASNVPVQMLPRPSGLEAKRSTSVDSVEMSHSRTNYYALGAHSTRSSKSEPVLVNRNTVKHSSFSDDASEERVLTNIDTIEMKFQKEVQAIRSRDNEARPSDQQKDFSSQYSDRQELFNEVNEVCTSKLTAKIDSRSSSTPIPASPESEGFNIDSVDGQKSMLAQRTDLQELGTKRTDTEMKRPHGDEALYKLSCRRNIDDARSCTSDKQQKLPRNTIANDEKTDEKKEVLTYKEPATSISNPSNSSQRVAKEMYKRALSKPVSPPGHLKCDLRQWLTENIGMDLGFQDQVKSSEHISDQQQKEEILHTSGTPHGDEESRKSASAQSHDSVAHQSVTEEQQGGNISISQNEVGLQHVQYKLNKSSSSTSPVSAFEHEPTDSLKRTHIRGGVSSEESSSNLAKRTLLPQNIPEGTNLIQLAWESSPYGTDIQQDEGQNEDEDSEGGTKVQSEQGSYSPSEGNAEWIADFPTTTNASYLDNSDAFNSETFYSDAFNSDVPESN